MKKILIVITFLSFSIISFAQNVGIGTTNPLEKFSPIMGMEFPMKLIPLSFQPILMLVVLILEQSPIILLISIPIMVLLK